MQLSQKRVVVMGLGRFGGGVGVARFLVSKGARVLVTDRLPVQKLTQSVQELAGLPLELRLGEHRESDFASADLVVVNPAVDPSNNPYLAAARSAGAKFTSEIRLLVQHLPRRARTIGITGSAGKSTTTAMIGEALAAAMGREHVHVGGNLGGSLLQDLARIGPDDWVVLELSSFMLEGLREDGWSPHVAVVTNLSPNHLDRHKTLEAYRAAKQAILDHQTAEDAAVLGPGLDAFTPRTFRIVRVESGQTFPHDLALPGEHNRLNAAMALEAAKLVGADPGVAAKAIAAFRGLPHRLQLVAEHAGVRYFNDSKATTPEAASLALRCFAAGTVHVILGGYDKKSDLAPLARQAAHHCRAIYTVGVTGPSIARAAQEAAGSAQIVACQTLDRAVHEAASRAERGDVVLLSPACASWDQFENYEQRGDFFARLVALQTQKLKA